MWQPKYLILVAVSLSVLACAVVGDGGGRPLVTAVTKDAATSLYTIPVKSGRPLVLDLSGPIVWSTASLTRSRSAIFGGGPLFVLGQPISEMLGGSTPLRKHGDSPGYYSRASRGSPVDGLRILPGDHAPLTIGLSTTTPYTELRSDVYRLFINAFDQAMERWGAAALRVPSPAESPFELCYNNSKLSQTRFGFFVPRITLMLDGGTSWQVFGMNSIVRLKRATACLAFVEMKAGNKAGYGGGAAPAVVIGGFQMENMLLVFDEEKQTLGFTTGRHLITGLSCGHFNFTMPP
uniref:Basic 7S globulin 2 n=1 Tax=Aegilops tauschii TaxID=37682 RepID=M8AVZ8_AEGTA